MLMIDKHIFLPCYGSPLFQSLPGKVRLGEEDINWIKQKTAMITFREDVLWCNAYSHDP